MLETGDAIPLLRKRVQKVFGDAEEWRANRIATTESSRAYHASQLQAAIDSQVVAGWEWLKSANCCDLCDYVASQCPRVQLGQAFATGVGNHPEYSTVRYPPLHPHDRCSVIEILKAEYGGPKDVDYSETLIAPQKDVKPKEPRLEKFKPSTANLTLHNTTRQKLSAQARKIFGRPVSLREIASMTGMPDGSDALCRVASDQIQVLLKNNDVHMLRSIEKGATGPVIHNEYFRCFTTGDGTGLNIFARQVEYAAKARVSEIQVQAARGPDMNGYYTWPRFGYDGPLPVSTRLSLPQKFDHVSQISELMETKEGRDYWKQNGHTLYLSFDPKPGSPNREVLHAYRKEKARKKLSKTGKTRGILNRSEQSAMDDWDLGPHEEPPDLSKHDDELLDAIWDKIGRERAAERQAKHADDADAKASDRSSDVGGRRRQNKTNDRT
jgi:hypothetical protein